MIKREEINGMIFIAQTTYYVYESENKLQKSEFTLCCTDKKIFDVNKKLARDKEIKKESNKFIVL